MRIGVDLGGTKIEAVALNADGDIIARRRLATPAGNYHGTVRTVADLVDAIEQEIGHTGTIGVGIPGTISPSTGLVKNANSTCLIGQPLDTDLADALARPVRLANDADCFTLSEAVDGSGAGARSVFGVIIGTGTGGGLAIEGNLLSGPNSIAGEWGHNPLPWPEQTEHPGPQCYCGKRACIETFLSGPGMARDHLETTGQTLTADEIAEQAITGEATAAATLERYMVRLAKSLAMVLNLIDPEVVVLGGGISNIQMLYERVPHLWDHYAFSDTIVTSLRHAKHGDSSGVRGAAWLWPAATDPHASPD